MTLVKILHNFKHLLNSNFKELSFSSQYWTFICSLPGKPSSPSADIRENSIPGSLSFDVKNSVLNTLFE